MPKFTHSIRLHYRSLSLTQIPFEKLFRSTQRVYGQYGIKIEFRSGKSLGLPEEQAQRLKRFDGECQWTIESGEYWEVQMLGGQIPSTEIAVFYVAKFAPKKDCWGAAGT